MLGFVSDLPACSSARLDSSTKAFTFDTPTLEGSAASTANAAPTSPPPKSATTIATSPSGSATPAAPKEAGQPTPQVCSRLPDPKPLVTDRWVRLTVLFEKGQVSLVRATPEKSKTPHGTARKMGRFAAELWIGCELIDRVRFDFPLLASEALESAPKRQPLNFEEQGRFEAMVLVPDSERATRLEIRDRAREERPEPAVNVPWPLSGETKDGSLPQPNGRSPTSLHVVPTLK